MITVELIDFKGDHIELIYTGTYSVSRAGLVETWCYAGKEWLPEYQPIPLPVFTEWF